MKKVFVVAALCCLSLAASVMTVQAIQNGCTLTSNGNTTTTCGNCVLKNDCLTSGCTWTQNAANPTNEGCSAAAGALGGSAATGAALSGGGRAGKVGAGTAGAKVGKVAAKVKTGKFKSVDTGAEIAPPADAAKKYKDCTYDSKGHVTNAPCTGTLKDDKGTTWWP